MKTETFLLLSIIMLVFPLIHHTSSMPDQNMHFAFASDNFSETYLVSTINSSFSHGTWGEYQVTIYYPSINPGASQPPNTTGAPYPTIVFAHGFSCTKDDYSWIGNYCATQGYVAILFTTPSQIDPFSAFPQSAEGFSLAIDHLANQNQKAGGLLEGIIDEERIGVMGHSMGAMTSLEAAAEDPRIKTVVSLAPGYFDFLSFSETYLEASKSIMVPTQIIMGSEDTICTPSGGRKYYDNLPSEKEMLIISGAFHDLGIWNAGTEPAWLGAIPGFDPVKQEHYRNTTRRYFMSWFNYYLYDYSDYQMQIYGQEAWNDLELGVLSDLETRRQYDIIVVDNQSNPVEDAEVTLYHQDFTVLWNGFTDSSGVASINLTLTRFNYTHTYYLEAVKGNDSLTEEISIPNIHPLPKVVAIPEFPRWISLLLILMVITFAIIICKRRLRALAVAE